MPDYDPMVHYVDPYDFFGVIDDNWEEIGKAVYTEVVFVGPIHTEYNEPHPIFLPSYPDDIEYSWDPLHSEHGKVTFDPSINSIFFKHAALGTTRWKIVHYDKPVDRRESPFENE